MHDTTARTEHRLRRFISERLDAAGYRARSQLTVTAWEVPDEPVPFAEALTQDFAPFEVGSPWGRPWSTVWFHVRGQVPEGWAQDLSGAADGVGPVRLELLVDLGFSDAGPGFQTEGAIWSPDGVLLKGLEPRNHYLPLDVAPGEWVDLYVEAAANPDVPNGQWIKPTPMGDKATAGTDPIYELRAADLALLDVDVWELHQDVTALQGLMLELPADSPRRAEILRALEDMLDAVDPDDLPGTAASGREALADVRSAPASASAHRLHAVGHAHIDSAWLWPVRETVRKCARTFANVLNLMDTDPDVTFACSSAQQYAWMKEYYPELYARIAERVREGRFIPVGGMWVESDTNMPGGEALARQFVAGTQFFIDEFGVEPKEVWLPDSFGYTAALPQIARASGKEFLLTQKISWNDTNRFPHHTFEWAGTDGTRIFTHFPPVDTYNSMISGAELAKAQRQYAEKGRANTSLLPYGYGDGGGGPTREMLAAARRTADLEGSPKVTLSTPENFFTQARAEYADPPTWTGEMYLEYHRGTYTSQHRTKAGNRRSEHLLREAELWAATATVRTGAAYPADDLRRIWRLVLLQQFHDILPGSSIAWVHREAERNYTEIAAELESLIATAIGHLVGTGQDEIALNAGPFARAGVPALGGAAPAAEPGATIEPDGEGWVLSNSHLQVVVDARGLVTSLRDLPADREVVPAGMAANLLQVHRDIPNEWDAWDIDAHYRRVVSDLDAAEEIAVEPAGGGEETTRLVIRRRLGSSTITQRLELADDALEITTEVDWHERQKLLKLAFPVDVQAERATSEIQFGHLHRPTATNTSWDAARFETVAHRWVHVGEAGYGVAVANDQTYGHDIRADLDPAGRPITVVRQSLLRAPLFPDPDADQGAHVLRSSIRPGAGIAESVQEGYRMNLPVRTVAGAGTAAVAPLLRSDNDAVVIEAVKLAEDGSGDVIVRLYESLGGRATAAVTADFPVTSVTATDLLERPLGEGTGAVVATDAGTVTLGLRPFQICTLRFAR
ncbi:alpha-mannosidase [Occultella glacieicola]|uniref:Alpha-mannosidase n=1 Tax=Occultella glacieicola TaxID=2518684 RepID=A0ABY2E7N6_9MICO|nr:glycoside hydrolase family 38 C-terminal domain-containing protein [Occultella glacieicola]TDE97573.1 alpha-mannosidase [Occultella glacieicola]